MCVMFSVIFIQDFFSLNWIFFLINVPFSCDMSYLKEAGADPGGFGTFALIPFWAAVFNFILESLARKLEIIRKLP